MSEMIVTAILAAVTAAVIVFGGAWIVWTIRAYMLA